MKINAIPDVRKDIVVETFIVSPFKLAVWLLQKLDGSWRMTGDHCRLNQVVASMAETGRVDLVCRAD